MYVEPSRDEEPQRNEELVRNEEQEIEEEPEIEGEPEIEEEPEREIEKIYVDIPRTKSNHKNCVVCSKSRNLVTVSSKAITNTFIKSNILIPTDSRCCRSHLDKDKNLKTDSINNLVAISNETLLTGYEVKLLLDSLRHSAATGIFGKFRKSNTISEKECIQYTGLNKKDFGLLQKDLVSLKNSTDRNKAQALATYLFWLKTGLDYRTIASIFSLDQFQTVGRYCSQVRNSLSKDFTPKYLGASHLNREEWISHNSTIVNHLFTDNDQQLAIIADGTYCYCQKSTNNYFQRKSYSMQKKRHLIKPFVICAADGHILDVYGLYPATENDATIIKKILKKDKGLRNLLQPGDHILIDRGFRDAIDDLKTVYHLQPHMPSCIPPKQKQLTTLEANHSRFVTKCRWPVEVVNGHMKTLFRVHDKVVTNKTLSHTLNDFRISAALINRFHKRLLSDKEYDAEIAQEMKAKLNTINELENIVEKYGLNKKRKEFKKIDSNTIGDFPKIDQETIKKKITLGSYQLRQSLSYLAERVDESDNLPIELYVGKQKLFDDDRSLLRGRLQSRHCSSTIYNSYVTYWPNQNSINSINGWLCTCKNGKRTVGCCSHVGSVIYYLSHGKYGYLKNPSRWLSSIFPLPVVAESSDEEDENDILTGVTQEYNLEQHTSIYPDLPNTSGSLTTTFTLSDFGENRDQEVEDNVLTDATEEYDWEQYTRIYPDLNDTSTTVTPFSFTNVAESLSDAENNVLTDATEGNGQKQSTLYPDLSDLMDL